jgi:hypothetical protein
MKVPLQTEPAVFDSHTYPCQISLVWHPRAWKKFTDRLGLKNRPYACDSAARVSTFSQDGRHDEIVIVFDAEYILTRPRDCIIGLIAHELVHVLQGVEEAIEGKLGDEGQAYLVQGLMMWVLGEMKRFLK